MSVDPRDPWSWPVHTFESPLGPIAYVDSGGEGSPLLLVHGLPTAKELWFPLIPHLPPGLRIVALDLLNYGASGKPRRQVHHREQAAIVDALRRHLGLGEVTLIAHDLGASVAIDVMGAHPEGVARLILMSPPVYPEFREPPVVKLLRLPGLGHGLLALATPLLFRAAMGRGLVHRARLTPRIRRAMIDPYRGDKGALRRNLWWGRPAEVFAAYPEIIRRIAVPTMIIQGCADPYIPHAQVQRLHQDVAGATVRMIADGAHFLPIDAPEEVAAAIVEHLAAHPRRSDPPLPAHARLAGADGPQGPGGA